LRRVGVGGVYFVLKSMTYASTLNNIPQRQAAGEANAYVCMLAAYENQINIADKTKERKKETCTQQSAKCLHYRHLRQEHCTQYLRLRSRCMYSANIACHERCANTPVHQYCITRPVLSASTDIVPARPLPSASLSVAIFGHGICG